MEYLMRDLIPEYIETYEGFQQMPLEMIAEIDKTIEERPNHPMMEDILDTRMFLEVRYAALQHEIDRWKAAAASGSKVLMVNDGVMGRS